jgi:hypothetical protein
MVLKTLGKLLGIFLVMLGMLATAAVAVFILALMIRFRVLLVVAAVFIGIGYFITWASGIEIRIDPKYRRVGADGRVVDSVLQN